MCKVVEIMHLTGNLWRMGYIVYSNVIGRGREKIGERENSRVPSVNSGSLYTNIISADIGSS